MKNINDTSTIWWNKIRFTTKTRSRRHITNAIFTHTGTRQLTIRAVSSSATHCNRARGTARGHTWNVHIVIHAPATTMNETPYLHKCYVLRIGCETSTRVQTGPDLGAPLGGVVSQ